MGKLGRKRFSILLVSCIMIVLLLFYAFVDFTFAWLFTNVEKDSTGTTNLAKVDSSHTATSEIEITMPQASYSLSLANKVLISNTGSTDALLRVFYAIYIDENLNQIATTSAISELNINSEFVASDENIENVYSGYYYYNSYVPAGGEVNFLNSVVPTNEIANKPVKIKVMYELVNYVGGAYQLGQDLPWDNTPASWAFNYDYVTKANESIISPKLDIKFSEISKIQLTAKTTSTMQNILFCQYNGAYIAVHNNVWGFSGLTAEANITPAQFTNGDFNTVVFTIHSCSAANDDYVTFVWDSVWSKEVSYKQIKIWDKDGDLVYDLVPRLYVNSIGVVYLGYFYDKVTETQLNMYSISGTTLDSTTNTYDGFSELFLNNTFEDYSEGYSLNCGFGAQGVITSEISRYGNKCLKLKNTKNIDDVTDSNFSRWGLYDLYLVAGYRYTLSIWVKSDAPIGAKSYTFRNGSLIATMPGIQILSSKNSLNIYTSYYSSNDWTLISITTPIITESGNASYCFNIPTGTEYTTYIDDLVVRAHI